MKLNCSKCGSVKVGSYVKESWCGDCIGERRKQLRAERRAQKDLPPIGSGRDPKCKICRAVKEDCYKDGSWCGACKLEKLRVAYEKKCQEQGKSPRRKGRNPICKCGKTKENNCDAFCRACTSLSKVTAREKQRTDPVWRAQQKEKNVKKYKEDLEYRQKQQCRKETHRLLRKGLLERMPCSVCGSFENNEAHHEDYSKPMEVIWFCAVHHHEHHKNLKQEE